jgi:hypothetical protein
VGDTRRQNRLRDCDASWGSHRLDGGTSTGLVALVGVGEAGQGGTAAVKTASGFGNVKPSGVLNELETPEDT